MMQAMVKMAHLSNDRLVEIGLMEAPSAAEQQHLAVCQACESQRASVAHLLDEVSVAAHEETEAAFPAERLARQQTRILARIDEESASARVIAFPRTVEPSTTFMARTRPASRWIAAAAAAGLLVGLVAGRAGRAPVLTAPAGSAQSVRAASATLRAPSLSDEELLGQIELAIDGRGGASLRPLDDLTPRAWEVR